MGCHPGTFAWDDSAGARTATAPACWNKPRIFACTAGEEAQNSCGLGSPLLAIVCPPVAMRADRMCVIRRAP